jgi:hypothetical protein
MVLKALNDTEARIGRIINTNEDMKDFATKLEEAAANNNSPPADEAANDD